MSVQRDELRPLDLLLLAGLIVVFAKSWADGETFWLVGAAVLIACFLLVAATEAHRK